MPEQTGNSSQSGEWDDAEIPMVHHLCGHCGMSATIVQTPTGERAWSDHMATHGLEASYESWWWSVVPLRR